MAEESVNAMLEVALTNPYSSVPPLEVFSAHPFFWKPSKIYHVWRDAGSQYYQNLKAEDRVIKLFDVQNGIKVFIPSSKGLQEIDSLAIQHEILGSENNWEIALKKCKHSNNLDQFTENPLYYYLTSKFCNGEITGTLGQVLGLIKTKKGQQQQDPDLAQKVENHNRRLSNLLLCIRHKFEHKEDLPPEGKKALGILTENPQPFVQIFIDAFPKLVPFVGFNRGSFSDYKSFTLHKHSFPFDLNEFLVQLNRALDYNIMTGGLEKRYQDKLFACNLTLEFRKADRSLEIPDMTTAMAAIIGKSSMKIIWSGTKDELTYPFSGDTSLENTCIIFSKTGCKVDQLLVQCTGNRIIIVDEKDTNLYETVNTVKRIYKCNLVEVEVNWEDIRQCKGENYAFTQNVYFHKLKVPIKQILSEQELKSFLKELKGEELNKLLRNEAFQIFDKYEKPSLLDFHINREFLEKVVIESDTLTRDMQIEHDIFIICGIKYEAAKNWFPENQKPLIIEEGKTDDFRVWGSDELRYRIVVIEDSMEWSADIFEIIGKKNWFKTYNIHCFKHIKQKALTWIGSKGNDSVLNEMSDKFLSTKQSKLSEDSLVDAIPDNIRAIILSGVPGLGKSATMNKIANDMFDKYENRIVAVVEIEQFVAKLNEVLKNTNNELHISTVVNTLTELGCESDFEKQVAKKVLLSSQANAKAKVKIELMFDRFDEAASNSRVSLINSVKYIIDHMPMIRIWISTRDHLVHETESLHKTAHVTMMPLSKEQQTDLVLQLLREYIKKNSKSITQIVNDDMVKTNAEKCTNMKLSNQAIDIARIPLHCNLIFQFYAEGMLQNNFSMEESSLTLYQLYENVFPQNFLLYHNLQKSYLEMPVYKDFYNRMLRRHIYCALKLFYFDGWAEWDKWFQQKLFLNEEDLKDLESLVQPYGLILSLKPIRFLHLTFGEYLVAFFIQQLIIKQLEYEKMSTEETTFLEFAWKNTLCIDKIPGKEYPDFKNPSIAYFLDASLASYVKDKKGTKHPKSMEDCKAMNDKMMKIILFFDPHVFSGKSKEFKARLDIKVAPSFPFQNLFIFQLQNGQFEFCKQIILMGKGSSRDVFHTVYGSSELDLIKYSFRFTTRPLFVVRPNLNTEAFIKSKLLSENDEWLNKLKKHVEELLSLGNLRDNALLKWVKFIIGVLKNTENERRQGDKYVDVKYYFLWYAVLNRTSNSKNIEYLCKLGIDVNMSFNSTPLMLAAEQGRIDLVETLLTEGADISLTDYKGYSVFCYAAESGSVDVMKILLQKDSTLFKKSGVSILRKALKSRRVPLAKYLLSEFQHLISEISTDVQCIYHCFALGTEFIQQFALNLNVRLSDEKGNTPLHFSLGKFRAQKDIAIALLEAEADIYAVNCDGHCPIYTGLKFCNLEVMREIVRAEPLNSSGKECRCKLHAFIRKHYTRLNRIRRKRMRRFVRMGASSLPRVYKIRCKDSRLLYSALIYLFLKMEATQMHDEAFGFLYMLALSSLRIFGGYETRQEEHNYYINSLNLIESPDQNKAKLIEYIEQRLRHVTTHNLRVAELINPYFIVSGHFRLPFI